MIEDSNDIIAYAHIYSWQGTSVGAIHYYCELRCGSRSEKATAPLTERHATYLNKENRRRGYKGRFYHTGKEYDGFLERDEAVAAALSTYKVFFPQARCLLEGRHSTVTAFPVLALDGPDSTKDKLNEIAEHVESLDDWREEDPFVEEWEKLLAATLGLEWVPWIG